MKPTLMRRNTVRYEPAFFFSFLFFSFSFGNRIYEALVWTGTFGEESRVKSVLILSMNDEVLWYEMARNRASTDFRKNP